MKKYLGFFVMALLGGLVAIGITKFLDKNEGQTIEEKQQVYFAGQKSIPDQGRADFVAVSELANPTVVHIKTTIGKSGAQQEFIDPFHFFDQRMFPQMPAEATGSGVIITADGYIATNNHVIDGAEKIEVTLFDKRSYEAELVGKDPETDLALLKISEKGLNFLPFGNSDDLKVGEWVIAVGNPFNLTSTVTAGIVSAKGRNINLLRSENNEYAVENFIQTDAAVNPGNSGGALVNTRGELVGINTAIASKTGSFAGYSFAVPVNIARKVLDDLLRFGEVKRAILGVRIQDINAELAEQKGISELKGVYIPEVINGGAADKAGIKEGDVLLSVNGIAVNKASELQEQISKYHPGDKVKVILLRGGKSKEVDVILRSKTGEDKIVSESRQESASFGGASFENLTREEKQALGITNGVRIKKVGKGMFASRNVEEGFVITHIDKTKVNNVQDLMNQLKTRKGAVLLEGVDRNGSYEAYAIRID